MVLAVLMAVLCILGGACSTFAFDEEAGLGFRISAGACIGLAIMSLAGFLSGCLLGLSPVTLILATVLAAAPAAILIKPDTRSKVRTEAVEAFRSLQSLRQHPTLGAVVCILGYAALLLILVLVFRRAMFYKDGELYTGILNNWGDLPFHLATITRFAIGGNIPPEDPTFAGVHFTYPFMADLIAAMFVQAGASLQGAILLENLILVFALVGILAEFSFQLTRNHIAAFLSTALILLNGGLGWAMLFGDMRQNEHGLIGNILHLPHDYSIISDTTWRWGNSVTSLLVTQRSMLMGMPLTIIVLIELWKFTRDRKAAVVQRPTQDARKAGRKKKGAASRNTGTNPTVPRQYNRMIGAGVIAGLVPLVHVHSFIVAMTVAGCLCLIFRSWWEWAVFFAAVLVIALPQVGWLYAAAPTHFSGFFGFQFGWDRGDENVFWFWLKNTGAFIPLLILALAWRGKDRLVSKHLLLYYVPFALCFIAPNLFKFAPWTWDNIKILFYWYIASCPLVALLLLRFWRWNSFARIGAVALLVSMTLAGSMDIFRIASGSSEFLELDKYQIQMADMIEETTPEHALILHAAIHNNPLVLTGRRSLLGYPGHVWSHGIDLGHREQDIKQIYAGGPAAAQLIAQYGIDYAMVGSEEREAMHVNDDFFRQFPQVGGAGGIRLYKLR